jgi:cytosine/adenosine deaminase-related metal-dependent hydrolase
LKTLLYGKYVIAGAGNRRRIIKDGAVYVDGSRIKDVGEFKALTKSYRFDAKIGSDRHLVMPGLINSHDHGLGISLISRGIPDGPLETWVQEFFYRRMEGWNSYDNAMLSCVNQIENGITCFVNDYYSPNDLLDSNSYRADNESALRACLASGGRVVFALPFANQNICTYDDEKFLPSLPAEFRRQFHLSKATASDKAERLRHYLREFKEIHREFDGEYDRIRVYLGPSGPHWVSDDAWLDIKKTALSLKTGIHTHLVESRYQAQYGNKFLGKTPVAHLSNLGILGPEVSCAHSVWLSREDMAMMAKTGATAVHNPSSNLRLFNGIAPLLDMKQAGMSLALGLDGTTINDEQDMFQEMRLCSLLHRIPAVDGRHLTPAEILDINLSGGSKVALEERDIGAIEIGRKADIILVNTTRLTTSFASPKLSVVDLLLLRARGSDVDHVMINGDLVVRNKQFLRADKSKLQRRVRKWKERDSGLDRNLAKLVPQVRAFYKKWDEGEPTYRMNFM